MILKQLRWAIVWVTIVTILSLIPGDELPKAHWLDEINADKFVHIGMYAPFAFLLSRAFRMQSSYEKLRLNALWYAFFTATGWGIFMELLQGILPIGRDCSVFDMMA